MSDTWPNMVGDMVPARRHGSEPDEDGLIDFLPDGPALLYVYQERTTDTRTVSRVDHLPVHDTDDVGKRERALCRALLMHALRLLDEADGS